MKSEILFYLIALRIYSPVCIFNKEYIGNILKLSTMKFISYSMLKLSVHNSQKRKKQLIIDNTKTWHFILRTNSTIHEAERNLLMSK